MKDSFSQQSGDNVHQNVSSLDGMTRGSSCAPLSENEARKLKSLELIPQQKLKKASDIVQEKGILILHYEIREESGLSNLMFKKISDITLPSLQPKYPVETTQANIWLICYPLLILIQTTCLVFTQLYLSLFNCLKNQSCKNSQ